MFRALNILYTFLFLIAIMLLSCTDSLHEQDAQEEIPEGCVRVNFTLSGSYGGPLSDLSRSNPLDDYSPVKIPDGTTLWIAVYNENSTEPQQVKSFVVKGNTLYPCKVDDDGNVTDENDVPLYLESGTYTFRAVGPARKLTENKHLYIDNGQYVIANDERDRFNIGLASTTKGTKGVEAILNNTVNSVVEVQLNPLINQTAKLKFTIKAGDNVYKLGVQSTGVEIDGLQDNYSKSNDESSPWNWTLATDTLIAYRGNNNTKLTLTEPVEQTDEKVVYETSILPTDAYSTPLIILFSMRVNGVPSQFQMMLNRKIFLTGYSYHYMGTINLEGGIAAMDWMNVGWETNVPIM